MGRRVWIALAAADQARNADRDDNDGLLTAEEITTLNLTGTDWVVLSACHSALAESWTREGVLGMRRAFLLAGVRSVIASQWAVEDEATAEWMRELYRVRAAGEERAAAALQATCRSMLGGRRRSGRTTHPFYWAGFIATGN
jgi:CHAT domain-containing protein